MRTIAVTNQKGGSGKTTTAVNLAAALGELRRRAFKIIATAHLKQIDRVLQDLTGSAVSLKEKSTNAITVGFAAVNYSEHWTGMEGTRSFPVSRRPQRALQESDETSRRLLEIARPTFDEFVLLKFKATNQDPFPFAWLNPSGMASDYGAALVRIAHLYEQRF